MVSSPGALRGAAFAIVVLGACKFPYPADVPDIDAAEAVDAPPDVDAAPTTFRVGGDMHGLWNGATITLRLAANDVDEDLSASAGQPFRFEAALPDRSSYLVTVVDDGPDHDCSVQNGSGTITGTDVVNLVVSCTNLIPHGIMLSIPTTFAFDPRVSRHEVPLSLLQQELTVSVSGPTLTVATVAGQAVTIGQPSAPVALGAGETTVPVVVSKGVLSKRYDLVFARGEMPIANSFYARASNPGLLDVFGEAVAAWGDHVAIGAPSEDSSNDTGSNDDVSNSGAVYIFRRAEPSWTQSQLLKGTQVSENRSFGAAVAMERDILVIGAPRDNARGQTAGAAYVFRLDPSTGRWVETQRITASDAHAGDLFGSAVAVSGDRIAIAAPRHDHGGADTNYGLVYVYVRTGTSWVEEGRAKRASPSSNQEFGTLLSLHGDAMAAGRPLAVLRRSGTMWIEDTVPPIASADSLAVQADTLIVGQSGDASGNGQPGDQSAPSSGAVRVYTRAGTVWSETAYLKASPPVANAQVGRRVALRDNVIATTSRAHGALLTFERVGGSWIGGDLTVAAPAATILNDWPSAVALSRNGAAFSGRLDNGPANASVGSSGTAWFFR